MAALQKFEIDYQGSAMQIAEHRLPSGRVFYIEFAQPKVKPLVITVAEDDEGHRFWTSLPEGRQEEATEIGRLVAAFIRNKR